MAGCVGAPLSLDFAPFETGVFVFSAPPASCVPPPLARAAPRACRAPAATPPVRHPRAAARDAAAPIPTWQVLGATTIMADGRSNWLKGLVLVAAYVVLAAAFFFHEDPPGVNGATWVNKDVLHSGDEGNYTG